MADPSLGVAADAPDLTEAERKVRTYLAVHGDDNMERVLVEYDRRGADLLAEKREHVRTIDDALKVRDAWTAQHAAVIALAAEWDGLATMWEGQEDYARASVYRDAAKDLSKALGVEKTDG